MKNGFLVIIQKDGQYIAAVRRADGELIELLLVVTDAIRALDGKPCEYILKKGTGIVRIDGKDIFNLPKQVVETPVRAAQSAPVDWRKEMRQGSTQEERHQEEKKTNMADSFSVNHLRVPHDTKGICNATGGGDNFALKFNKFGRYDFKKDESEKHFKFFNAQNVTVGRGNEKRIIVPTFSIRPNFGKLFSEENPSQIAHRVKTSAQAVFSEEGQLLTAKFRPEWRFVTGLGGASIYETGITLHHVYGIPYIPASEIKGILRSWIIKSYAEFDENEGLAIENEDFCEVFGCPAKITVERKPYESAFKVAQQGKITFFDAMPTHKPTIEVDVMNPHYPKYYGGKGAPVDTDSPNPIFFLTVAKTTFQFLMATKEEGWNLENKLFLGKTLSDWLKEALSEHGLGAKTAVGYGYFKPQT